MKRIAFVAVLLAVLCVAFPKALSLVEGGAVAADEPTTTIALSFGARHVVGHEAEGKAAWEAFCQTAGATDGKWKFSNIARPGVGDGGVGTCTLRLTNAQLPVLFDAIRVLLSNKAFADLQHVDMRIMP